MGFLKEPWFFNMNIILYDYYMIYNPWFIYIYIYDYDYIHIYILYYNHIIIMYMNGTIIIHGAPFMF